MNAKPQSRFFNRQALLRLLDHQVKLPGEKYRGRLLFLFVMFSE